MFLFRQAPPFLSRVLSLFKSHYFWHHLLPSVFRFNSRPDGGGSCGGRLGRGRGGRNLCQKLEVGRSLEDGDVLPLSAGQYEDARELPCCYLCLHVGLSNLGDNNWKEKEHFLFKLSVYRFQCGLSLCVRCL